MASQGPQLPPESINDPSVTDNDLLSKQLPGNFQLILNEGTKYEYH